MGLSRRLTAVVSMVAPGNVLADVGCDHGFVAMELIAKKKANHVFAMDVRPGPLSRAKEHIGHAGLSGQIDCILSDGLTKLTPGSVDGVIIAGMGGLLITSILDAAPQVVEPLKQLILSPHRDIPTVRQWLGDHGFVIDEETMVCEDEKYYVILHGSPTTEKIVYTPAELNYGPIFLKTRPQVWKDYLKKEYQKQTDLLEQLDRKSQGASGQQKKDLLQASVDELKQLLEGSI